ncbi:MAG: flavoprotein [Pseudomonadota bacterium]
MIHVPKATEVFTEDGGFAEGVDTETWLRYAERTFQQFVWWDAAARAHLAAGLATDAFNRHPSQRNAP